MIDYVNMTGPELLAAVRDDASKWAAAFCQIAKTKGLDADEGWMIGWFASAIENSFDVRTGRSVTILDDGSAFFTATIEKNPDHAQ